jgi:hypothetical protein
MGVQHLIFSSWSDSSTCMVCPTRIYISAAGQAHVPQPLLRLCLLIMKIPRKVMALVPSPASPALRDRSMVGTDLQTREATRAFSLGDPVP